MAFSIRRLFKFNQLYAGRAILKQESAIAISCFSTKQSNAEGSRRPALKGDQMLKDSFMDVIAKFDTAKDVFRKKQIIIDPDNPKAIARFAEVMALAHDKAGMKREYQIYRDEVDERTKDIQDVRSHYLAAQNLRIMLGLVDVDGEEALMFEALDKVEKELKKPLLKSDTAGMNRLKAALVPVHKKLGTKPEGPFKVELEYELKRAKEELTAMKKECLHAMENIKKREAFKDEEIPDVRTLDIRDVM